MIDRRYVKLGRFYRFKVSEVVEPAVVKPTLFLCFAVTCEDTKKQVTYHAAYRVEYQPLNRSNSQLTYCIRCIMPGSKVEYQSLNRSNSQLTFCIRCIMPGIKLRYPMQLSEGVDGG